ncbi:MAG: hypothetical protein EA417_04330 [Gammaproteobacteria bacterium]|nr:MAG: hypothetical protein EA417_04330 [Gammaproteobacteria bacterium]
MLGNVHQLSIGGLATTETPPAPADLAGEGLELWNGVASEYGICDAGGLQLLAAAARAAQRAQEARQAIERDGLLVSDRFGVLRAHAAVRIEQDARSQMLQALKQLHLDVEPLRDGPGRPPGR